MKRGGSVMRRPWHFAAGLLGSAVLAFAAGAAHGQGYPAKPVRIVAPYQEKLASQSFVAEASGPAPFAAYIKDEIAKYARIVKDANIRVD